MDNLPVQETQPKVEPQGVPETAPAPEIPLPPPPPPAKQDDNKNDQKDSDDIKQDPSPPKNVVDKTDTLTTLHEIKKPTDSLTDFADDEEEEFIKEVEEHHGHN
ncbi:hypothetical protein ACFL13_02640 [Patescibacteria group bacterium]